MSGDRRWGKKQKLPEGYETLSPVMEELNRELRDKINEGHEGKRRVEAQWPVHQINWQRTRYVYDMFARYHKISKEVYDYCIKQKLVDAALIAKWKKPGYERLCSTHAIDPRNFNFGTVSICRVPRFDLGPNHPLVEDRHSGCRGCTSGRGGRRNIFGNKYGQYLAAIQVSREERAAKGEDVAYDSIWATTEDEAKFDDARVEDSDDEDTMNRRKRRRKLQPVDDQAQAEERRRAIEEERKALEEGGDGDGDDAAATAETKAEEEAAKDAPKKDDA